MTDKFSFAKKMASKVKLDPIVTQLHDKINPHNLSQKLATDSKNIISKQLECNATNQQKKCPDIFGKVKLKLKNTLIDDISQHQDLNQIIRPFSTQTKKSIGQSIINIDTSMANKETSIINIDGERKKRHGLKNNELKNNEKVLFKTRSKENKNSLWSEKYRPNNLDNIVGNKEQIEEIEKWFAAIKKKILTLKNHCC